eukprot:262640-Pleurochrysis_carterae.AAC.1
MGDRPAGYVCCLAHSGLTSYVVMKSWYANRMLSLSRMHIRIPSSSHCKLDMPTCRPGQIHSLSDQDGYKKQEVIFPHSLHLNT